MQPDKAFLYFSSNGEIAGEATIWAISPHRLHPNDVQDGWVWLTIPWGDADAVTNDEPHLWYIDVSGATPTVRKRERPKLYTSQETMIRVLPNQERAAVRFSVRDSILYATLDIAYEVGNMRDNHLIVVAHRENDPRVPLGTGVIRIGDFEEDRTQSLGISVDDEFELLVRGPYRNYSFEE